MSYLNEFERAVLHEALEDEGPLPLYQLIYDLSSWDSDLEIHEVYRLAVDIIWSLFDKGLVQIEEVSKERHGKDVRIVGTRPISRDELSVVLRQPRNWDRAHTWSEAEEYQIVSTPAGDKLYDSLANA